MKRIISSALLICLLLLSGCKVNINENQEIKGQFGEQIGKRPVRMINIDGELYYDSGRVSETVRCGMLDGALKKATNENEIPFNSGEANFDADGYQRISDRIEVYADNKWLIFEKYDNQGVLLDGMKYCFYIRGHLNNAAVDSEIIALSEIENITFNDIYEPLLSSQYKTENNGKVHYNFLTPDKWGINLRVKNIASSGLTLVIEQSGGNPSGELQTGAEYVVEQKVGGAWTPLKSKIDAWTLIAYQIKMNDKKEVKLNWEQVYGILSPGSYRLKKEIMDFRRAGDYDKKIYEVYFTIK